MIDSSNSHQRLPRNFHKTFIPERQYIQAMLRYAAAGKTGDYQEIATETGIPMGVSSGKVPAILDYCKGMGLVQLLDSNRSAVKNPNLTPFGRVVFLEDPYLIEGVTQWIAHLNLCNRFSGADVWCRTFFSGTDNLGMSFSRKKLEEYLAQVYETQRGNLIGPLIRMYEDEASFKKCGVLIEQIKHITRKQAPIRGEYILAYGAWMLQLLSEGFSGNTQITTKEFDVKLGWSTIPGWDNQNIKKVLELLERKNIFYVDRHMEPWILHPNMDVEEAWGLIYEDLL